MFWLLLFVVAGVSLTYASASFATTTAVFGIAILLFGVFGHAPLTCLLLALAWAILLLPLNAEALRQEWFTRPLLERFRGRFRRGPWVGKPLPETSGSGWETQLLQPRMDWERLNALPTPALSDEEQVYLDGPVETFCRLCHAWRSHDDSGKLPDEIWTFLRRYGLLALRLPRDHGGLGFSWTAVAAILAKVASSPAGISVAEILAHANAHGLADWLLHDGSQAQRLRWLSPLARGEVIACTAPADFWKGSTDTAADYATGIVVEEDWEGAATPGVRLDLDRPAVALAPVAGLIGICCELRDPERRLGREEWIGASWILLPADTPGLEILAQPAADGLVPRGRIRARGLFVPLDWLLGGAEKAGHGARFAGTSLGLGRGLPLAAAAAGNATFVALASAALARMMRPQGHPYSQQGVVRERLARMAGRAYSADALRRAAAAAADRGESSSAAGVMLAVQTASLNESVARDAVALLGDEAGRQAPSGWLARCGQEAAIAKVAEGANVHGGYARAFLETLRHGHPFLGAELQAAHDDNAAQALEEFDALIWPHFARAAAAASRSWLLGMTGSLGATVPSGTARRHRQRASRYAAALTLTAEAALLSLGDSLGEHEVLLGRLGEILSLLQRLAALLRKWESDDRPADDWAIVDWACLDLFQQIEAAFAEAQRRLPSAAVRAVVRLLSFPLGHWARPPGPALTLIVAARLWSPGSSRQRLTSLCFAPRAAGGPLNALESALVDWLEAEPLARRCEEAQRQGRLPRAPLLHILPAAVSAGILTVEESERLKQACEAVDASSH